MHDKLQTLLSQYGIMPLIGGSIAGTSILSLALSVVAGNAGDIGIAWLSRWLLDFSTDLAGGVVVVFVARILWTMQQSNTASAEEATSVVQTQADTPATYFIDAQEDTLPQPEAWEQTLEAQHAERAAMLTNALVELKAAPTPEARQTVLNQLMLQKISLAGVSLAGVNIEYVDFSEADLVGVDMTKARLRNARLCGANLQNAKFQKAQLIEADLRGAHLENANFQEAYLSGANFEGATLQGAMLRCSLWGVNLSGANLQDVDLRGAELFKTNLLGANLRGAQLAEAKINRDTILPDGTAWNGKRDIQCFTDPNHPQFWQPD